MQGGQAVNPQYEAHERMCKSIGDMANENKRLQERIKLLEESLESANTLLQLVMCEQNQLRDVRNKANDRIKLLKITGDELLEWLKDGTISDSNYRLLANAWQRAKENKQ
jgi:chromosome segregation ATPase